MFDCDGSRVFADARHSQHLLAPGLDNALLQSGYRQRPPLSESKRVVLRALMTNPGITADRLRVLIDAEPLERVYAMREMGYIVADHPHITRAKLRVTQKGVDAYHREPLALPVGTGAGYEPYIPPKSLPVRSGAEDALSIRSIG